jgi:predicted deacylase
MDEGWRQAHAAERPRDVDALDLDALAPGELHRLALGLAEDSASRPIRIPVLCARGVRPGPVVGITAAVHGNELNGIPTIHRLFTRIDPRELTGTVIGVPIVNVPGFMLGQRECSDRQDLNRLMPGKPDGNEAQVYAHRFVERVLKHLDYLIDLHTASFGRANSLYVRADMGCEVTRRLARLVGAEIIVHNAGGDGTVRSAAAELGIHAITVEVGDPHSFDRGMIRASRIGLRDVLEHLGMLAPDEEHVESRAVECARSFWLYTDTGGILDVLPDVTEQVDAGQVIARLTDPWGQRLRTFRSPEAGIVIGKSTNPVAGTGARILHLGVVGAPAREP